MAKKTETTVENRAEDETSISEQIKAQARD
jgi:hypothetical protein